MLFKIAFRNMRRSLRDYTIYFLTLLFGICIFYMFNALGSQSVLQNFMSLAESAKNAKDADPALMGAFGGLEKTMDYVSAFVACILGFLVVYANMFMIRKRKKEFGVYLTLGMSSFSISGILVIETLLVGLVSLAAGIVSGVFLSQLMSVFVVQMFGIEAEGMTFVFSMQAMLKTMLYFGVVFVLTLFVNMISVSGSRLVRLLNAGQRAKTMKIRRPVISIALFAFGVLLLAGGFVFTEIQYQYLGNSVYFAGILTSVIPVMIIAVVVIIISISGFLISLLSVSKRIRFNGLNVFVIKQLGSKLYSTVVSMTITTFVLTITLTAIAASFADAVAERVQMEKNYPMDVMVVRRQMQETVGREYGTVYDDLKNAGFDMSLLSEYEEFSVYTSPEVPGTLFFGEDDYNRLKEMKRLDPFAIDSSYDPAPYEEFFSGPISVIYESDYNNMAKIYRLPQIKLDKDEYTFMCDVEGYMEVAQEKLSDGHKFVLAGTEYHPADNPLIVSNLYPLFTAVNTGVFIFPDGSEIYTDPYEMDRGVNREVMFAANYDRTKKSAKEIDRVFNGGYDMEASEDAFGILNYSPNEYHTLWEKVHSSGIFPQVDADVSELTEGMTPVYDESSIIAYHKEEDNSYWTVNEDKTGLIPFTGNIDTEKLWQYNKQHFCQFAYIEGYTEHVTDTGYPLAYEDADGKFYTTSSLYPVYSAAGRLVNVVIKLEPMEAEWNPEKDYIYDRKDDCIYELLPDGKKNKIDYTDDEGMAFAVDLSNNAYVFYNCFSRIADVEVSLENTSCILFIALYVGMVFLLACAAVLGLKQLSDSADNKSRYTTLRQIGCSEKMITGAFFRQILFFFLLPLILALLLSSFLLSYIVRMIAAYLAAGVLVQAIIVTLVILSAVYISFFIVTWLGCKRMIRDGAAPDHIN